MLKKELNLILVNFTDLTILLFGLETPNKLPHSIVPDLDSKASPIVV